MDIQKKREAFEKLSEIAEILKNKTIKFVEKTNKYYSYHYSVEYLNGAWMAWQAKAQAVPEGFVLIKDDTKTVVAIERMVEQQVEASGMDSRRLERLDGWKIIEAAVKAQEPAND